jgi:GNAT superfamily N-acetyltransferase
MPAEALNCTIREAFAGDAQRIVTLAHQLGYDVGVEHVRRVLEDRVSWREVFVAIVPRVGVVGWTSVTARATLLDYRAEIEGLVVDDEYRSNGIGALLLDRAETWARDRRCPAVRVLSNVVRERAHRFYDRRGYEILKSEYVFLKRL